ncbi:MAG TPA: polysaccharide biosynthesis tyrosine autokinase [Gaiellales bacterium]
MNDPRVPAGGSFDASHDPEPRSDDGARYVDAHARYHEPEAGASGTTVRDYLRLLRRRWWIVLIAVVIVPVVAVGLAHRQTARYEAQSQVLLTYQSFSGLLDNVTDTGTNLNQTPDRIATTQAELARVPTVVARTVAAVPQAGMTPTELLDSSTVNAALNADLLTFSVKAPTPALAIALASAYATTYTTYRHELDTAALQRARQDVSTRLAELKANGKGNSTLASKLGDTQQQLQTLETLQTSNATVVKTGSRAPQVAPQPIRAGVLGIALGLVLGLGLALLVDAFDTRVRSGEAIAEMLSLSLLGSLPQPPRKIRKRNGLVMMDEPYGKHAEAFRTLRTNLELANIGRQARVIAVASGLHAEGKSTTAANLALAMARGGRRVALIDLDLRKPMLAEFFHATDAQGVTDVALGRTTVAQALVKIDVRSFLSEVETIDDGRGRLDVLVAGRIPPNPSEFLASHRLATILADLRKAYEIVLVDTPPILSVGDALALSSRIDAFVLVSNLELTRRGELQKLRRALAFSRCGVLGTILTAAKSTGTYGYAGAYLGDANTRPAPPSSPARAATSPADA